jgi:hypothetical protein
VTGCTSFASLPSEEQVNRTADIGYEDDQNGPEGLPFGRAEISLCEVYNGPESEKHGKKKKKNDSEGHFRHQLKKRTMGFANHLRLFFFPF